MKHIIISDTHSPDCIDAPYEFIKSKSLQDDCDAVVINGDLLGVFSLAKSNKHKGRRINKLDLYAYLEACAPKFYKKFREQDYVTEDMIEGYVRERYDWCYETLKKFSELKFTIFNMGNHESPNHFLVLHEIPFLTGCKPDMIEVLSEFKLKSIFYDFEEKLLELEKEGNFKYLRYGHFILGDTMIIGIPGESHSTIGNENESVLQESKTMNILDEAEKDLDKVFSVIIYNHTQGKYHRETGSFWCASPSLSEFMMYLPDHILRRVFVQSHNHWSHSQFILKNKFNILMNNAGLHHGIFNVIDFDIFGMKVYDCDPKNNKVSLVSMCSDLVEITDDKALISRYYEDVDYVLARKNPKLSQNLDSLVAKINLDK